MIPAKRGYIKTSLKQITRNMLSLNEYEVALHNLKKKFFSSSYLQHKKILNGILRPKTKNNEMSKGEKKNIETLNLRI